jgi:hypothetical protein
VRNSGSSCAPNVRDVPKKRYFNWRLLLLSLSSLLLSSTELGFGFETILFGSRILGDACECKRRVPPELDADEAIERTTTDASSSTAPRTRIGVDDDDTDTIVVVTRLQFVMGCSDGNTVLVARHHVHVHLHV